MCSTAHMNSRYTSGPQHSLFIHDCRETSVYFFGSPCSLTNQAVLMSILRAPPGGYLQYNCLLYQTWWFPFQSRRQQFPQASTFKNIFSLIMFLLLSKSDACSSRRLAQGAACRVLDSRGGRSSSYVHLWNRRYEGYLPLLGQCHSTHTHTWQLAFMACLADPEAERRPSR